MLPLLAALLVLLLALLLVLACRPSVPRGPCLETVPVPRVNYRCGPRLSARLRRLYAEQLARSPGWTLEFLDDAAALRFLDAELPRAAAAWRSLVPGAFRADVLRLALLWLRGGLWSDLTQRALVPLDALTRPGTLCVCLEHAHPWQLYQALLSAPPRHPAVRAMLELVLENVERRSYGTSALDVTGPAAVGRALNRLWGRADATPFALGAERACVRVTWAYTFRDGRGLPVRDERGTPVCEPKAPWHREELGSSTSAASAAPRAPEALADYWKLWHQRRIFR